MISFLSPVVFHWVFCKSTRCSKLVRNQVANSVNLVLNQVAGADLTVLNALFEPGVDTVKNGLSTGSVVTNLAAILPVGNQLAGGETFVANQGTSMDLAVLDTMAGARVDIVEDGCPGLLYRQGNATGRLSLMPYFL